MTPTVQFWPVFAAFAMDLPWPFWFSLLAAASCSGLDISVLCSATEIACVLRRFAGSFPSNTEVTNASMFCILTAKKGRGEMRQRQPTEDQKCPKECKDKIFLIGKSVFPSHCHCGSLSRSFIKKLHKVTDFGGIVCRDSSGRKEKL